MSVELPGLHLGAATRWQRATVVDRRSETGTAATFRLRTGTPLVHRPGQHLVVRLTAPDGYKASRAYSIASAPDGGTEVEITVERLDEGEVSTFLHDDLRRGDEIEVRGPIGGFVWEADVPSLLVGGGSGVVPLAAMVRNARRIGTADRAELLVSVRTPADLYYAAEMQAPGVTVVYTRAAPPDARRPPGRLVAADVLPLIEGRVGSILAFVCGPSGFVEAAGGLLVAAGVPPEHVRVERFGPTG